MLMDGHKQQGVEGEEPGVRWLQCCQIGALIVSLQLGL